MHIQTTSGVKPPPLPKGWVEKQDPMGKVYYDNRLTHQTQWNRPLPKGFPETAEYRLKYLPPVKFVLNGGDSDSDSKGNSVKAKAGKAAQNHDKSKSKGKSSS
jgi:hypothetical protein